MKKNKEEYEKVVSKKSWGKFFEQNNHVKLDVEPYYDARTIKFGIVSDTHLGSKHQQISFLHTAYNIFDKENVNFVVHVGDLSEGNGSHYIGQIQELFLYTFDDQVKYIVSVYPKLKNGQKTYLITGDHDLDWYKEGGRDIGEAVAEQRSDIIYCGQAGAYLKLGGKNFIYLHHPDGGAAYAKSYKAQKVIENFAPENKPQIYISGHYHSVAGYMKIRNVQWVAPGAMQSQTQYLLRKSVEVVLSFVIVEVNLDKDGSIRTFLPKFHYLYIPKVADYPKFRFQTVKKNYINIKL